MIRSTSSRAPRIVIAGAGALGLACALDLARRGAAVTVCDPAAPLDNASGVAAGMLAPAFETLLDPLSGGHFDILRAARDLWPAFAQRLGVNLDLGGALWAGPEPDRMLARLHGIGAAARSVTAAEASTLAPGLAIEAAATFTPEDWRIDAPPTLAALRRAVGEAGVAITSSAVAGFSPGAARLANGERIAADRLVLAVGAAPADLAPELEGLSPVKGHILRLAGGPSNGPVVRAEGIYVRPHPEGAWAGATMEPGRADRAVDPAAVATLMSRVAALFPGLATTNHEPAVGVRATTIDGLPLVGPSRAPGVLLAAGARRNGWLLAPLVARLVGAQVFEDDTGPWAATLSPARF